MLPSQQRQTQVRIVSCVNFEIPQSGAIATRRRCLNRLLPQHGDLSSMFTNTLVSVIIPIHNGEPWIDDCLKSIVEQDVFGIIPLEISICIDASTDETLPLLDTWRRKLSEAPGVSFVVSSCSESDGTCKGVAYAKNQAVNQSHGNFLCFQDIDDIMLGGRISKQLQAASLHQDWIIGSKFRRSPEGSTERFTRWANTMSQDCLTTQVYTSHGPTVIMPTWFCHRTVFDRVGGFANCGRGAPEDLIFFYKHLDEGGGVYRVEAELLVYRYHPLATTLSVSEESIWRLRLCRLQEVVLHKWTSFCIWNAGKQGRRLFRSLTSSNRDKVSSFCDVDINKIGSTYEPHGRLLGEGSPCSHRKIPILHFTKAKPPFVICVKMDLTMGEFERNLGSLNLTEGEDYVMFS